MDIRQTITEYGEMIGCPNAAAMKRMYWSLSQQYVPETFLFIACSYYLFQEAQRSQPSAERLSFLFHEFILNQYSPLYVNVTGTDRMKAQALVNKGLEKKRSDAMQILASCVREVGRMIQGKLNDTHGVTVRSHMKFFDNPTKKVGTSKWMQVLFGAKEKIRVKTRPRRVDSDAIDLVINSWGETPWLAQLRTLS